MPRPCPEEAASVLVPNAYHLLLIAPYDAEYLAVKIIAFADCRRSYPVVGLSTSDNNKWTGSQPTNESRTNTRQQGVSPFCLAAHHAVVDQPAGFSSRKDQRWAHAGAGDASYGFVGYAEVGDEDQGV